MRLLVPAYILLIIGLFSSACGIPFSARSDVVQSHSEHPRGQPSLSEKKRPLSSFANPSNSSKVGKSASRRPAPPPAVFVTFRKSIYTDTAFDREARETIKSVLKSQEYFGPNRLVLFHNKYAAGGDLYYIRVENPVAGGFCHPFCRGAVSRVRADAYNKLLPHSMGRYPTEDELSDVDYTATPEEVKGSRAEVKPDEED
ncbi:uncharacterized protein C8R40DRAFT_1070445 [Lentinula edodes]|uniref:uncharacterized protein n=1 Tax=Lentinula edodes TaxID=5353 RepID=UPI001E8EB63D|nr:uncharacterized protein C8R40DRAFT_1070445 [Lentinula edodes]KAH7873933.1 hypothetical protein C8R40DRAFT_1070445 [Lentinula edodes]KAJ3920046.1 hypothetical protein F5877DRAFT_66064 [Lentinula edodes]